MPGLNPRDPFPPHSELPPDLSSRGISSETSEPTKVPPEDPRFVACRDWHRRQVADIEKDLRARYKHEDLRLTKTHQTYALQLFRALSPQSFGSVNSSPVEPSSSNGEVHLEAASLSPVKDLNQLVQKLVRVIGKFTLVDSYHVPVLDPEALSLDDERTDFTTFQDRLAAERILRHVIRYASMSADAFKLIVSACDKAAKDLKESETAIIGEESLGIVSNTRHRYMGGYHVFGRCPSHGICNAEMTFEFVRAAIVNPHIHLDTLDHSMRILGHDETFVRFIRNEVIKERDILTKDVVARMAQNASLSSNGSAHH